MNTPMMQIEARAMAHQAHQQHIAALRKSAEERSEIEVLRTQIRALEVEREEMYRDYAELIVSLQDYFPGANGIYDVFRGLERIEQQRDTLRTALTRVMHFTDAPDVIHNDAVEALWASKP